MISDYLSLELLLCCGKVLSAEGSGGADPTGLCGVLSLEPAERCCLVLSLSTNRDLLMGVSNIHVSE